MCLEEKDKTIVRELGRYVPELELKVAQLMARHHHSWSNPTFELRQSRDDVIVHMAATCGGLSFKGSYAAQR